MESGVEVHVHCYIAELGLGLELRIGVLTLTLTLILTTTSLAILWKVKADATIDIYLSETSYLISYSRCVRTSALTQ